MAKIAVVTPRMASGERGGAENLYDGLVNALRNAGHDASLIEVPVDESSFEGILKAYCTSFYLDLDDFDIVISTKAPTYMVRHRNHISYLLHTIRVFYDMFGSEEREDLERRRLIHSFDKYGLSPERIARHCVIGKTVAERFKDPFWRSVKFNVVHPAPLTSTYKEPSAGEFVLLPGRLHRWKRVDLVIRAMCHVKPGVRLVIAGDGEDRESFQSLAEDLGLGERVEFMGKVSDEVLQDLYSRAIVVPFVPESEDFGYITIEAFKSQKPVITCWDSGEPSLIVRDGESGFIVDPDPIRIAEKINYLIDHPDQAELMGRRGYQSVQDLTWDNVVHELLKGIDLRPRSELPEDLSSIKVLIADMQPIEPAVGGGRLRLKGLYSSMGPGIEALYLGSYDWKGPKRRRLKISGSLTELDVPPSDDHFSLLESLSSLSPGKTLIDVTFPILGEASPEYVEALCRESKRADVIIFSHPWAYSLLKTRADLRNKLLIYDSHNCEAELRSELLGRILPFSRCISNMVRFVEGTLCRDCNLVLACSEDDKAAFEKLYGLPSSRVEIYPNGVDVEKARPVGEAERSLIKEKLGIRGRAATFIGSSYPPNAEAARYIVDRLSGDCPEVQFLIVGGAGDGLAARAKAKGNVRIFGQVSDQELSSVLSASDIALNPMLHGSGTNIKMFDYFARGLPTISTPVGARGIRNDGSFIVCDLDQFPLEIRRILKDDELRSRLSSGVRSLAERHYDWNRISRSLGRRIEELSSCRDPFFSVVIPMYRGRDIEGLVDCLNRQTFRDFEVVIVDSGVERHERLKALSSFRLKYFHDRSAGAVAARNTGIRHARGSFIAFTDDDCRPDPDWLERAKEYLDENKVAGIEGSIYTDEKAIGDQRYRTITNKNLAGLGFMTANLIIRRDILERIGGFDERFDKPHFREDTDLAWRALQYGPIPFVEEVRVIHPPHLRMARGESRVDRDSFFFNDALLFKKHPERYIQLMKREEHYMANPDFWRFFMQGASSLEGGVDMERLKSDPEIARYIPGLDNKPAPSSGDS